MRLQANWLLLDSNDLAINFGKGQNTFYPGLDGEVMVLFEPHTVRLDYVTGLSIDFGSQTANWTNVSIEVVEYINWGMQTYHKGLITGH